MLVLSFISIISGLSSAGLIIFLFKSFRDRLKTLLVLMIIILSLLDILISFSAGIYRITLIFLDPLSLESDPTADVFTISAFLWAFGLRASIMIPFFFSISLYLEIEFAIRREGTKVKVIYFALIFILTLIWACVPLFFNGYGINEDAMLTILSPSLIFKAFYLPLMIIIFIIIGLIIRSIVLIKRTHIADLVTPFVYFPLVLILCYIFAITRRIFNIFGVDEPWLRLLMNMLMAMQGIFNTLYCIFMTQNNKNIFLKVFACQTEAHDEIIEGDSESSSGQYKASLIHLEQDYELHQVPNEKL